MRCMNGLQGIGFWCFSRANRARPGTALSLTDNTPAWLRIIAASSPSCMHPHRPLPSYIMSSSVVYSETLSYHELPPQSIYAQFLRKARISEVQNPFVQPLNHPFAGNNGLLTRDPVQPNLHFLTDTLWKSNCESSVGHGHWS